MEYSTSLDDGKRAAAADEYDLGHRLALAERRYAQARERSRQARDECHAIEAEIDARMEIARRARERYDAAQATCLHLQRLIEELEERLDD